MKHATFACFAAALCAVNSSSLAFVETPAKATYTYVRARWTGTEVFAERSDLSSLGYATEHDDIIAHGMESGILSRIGNDCDDYGGVLLVEAHGQFDDHGNYHLAMEIFSGLQDAIDRANLLRSGALFSGGDLQVLFVQEESHYGVCLTPTGIGNAFSGSNGLVILAACYGSNAFGCGIGGTRQIISWEDDVQSSTAQTEVNLLFDRLTGGDPLYMRTTTAINGTMKHNNTNWMALAPYIVSVNEPSYVLTDSLSTITWHFGARMNTSGAPYVGGYAVRRSYAWLNDSTLTCAFYTGWMKGDVIVGLARDQGQSNQGIPLIADDVHSFWCPFDCYPPAASVITFAPVRGTGGIDILTELGIWKDSRAFWITREDGTIVGDTVRTNDLTDSRFTVTDLNASPTDRYVLYEKENDGDVFIRADEGILPEIPQVIPYTQVDREASNVEANLLKRCSGRLKTPATDPIVGVIIVPDAWEASVQALADWHTSHGKPVSVVVLSATGNTREQIKSYLDTAYAEGVRYVLLGAGAHDEWFDEEQRWPDLPGEDDWHYWFHYYHDVMGYVSTPSRNIIPTWYYPDTEYDNRSYWTPYYVSDLGYATGLPGLRVGRFPAYTLLEFQVLGTKTLHYLESASTWPFAHDVSIWAYCHDSDGNVGHTVEVLADEISGMIPPSFVQHRQNDYTLSYSEREAWALNDWSAGRAYIFMSGTSSTQYRPIHFFKKDLGWHIGKLAGNQYFPVLLGTSCGIGAFDMFLHPTLGTIVAQDLMTGDPNRGTCVVIAPSRGTYVEPNQQLRRALIRHLIQEPAPDLGTALLMAQRDVADLDSSYCLYGDPLATLPFQSPETGIGDDVPLTATALEQNYPNPFNPVTTIEYSLQHNDFVTLTIFNVAGQLVATLVNEQQTAGPHRTEWDAAGKASGIYFCQLKAGAICVTRKMVVLR